MKNLFIHILLLMFPSLAFSQTFEEWFDQKNTQLKYLAQQIAANQVYIKYVQNGYKIAKEGLDMIGDLKDGHFQIDLDFFNSLKKVDPIISNSTMIVAIVSTTEKIEGSLQHCSRLANKTEYVTPNESIYINKVVQGLTAQMNLWKRDLEEVLTDDQLQMTNTSRMERISFIQGELDGCYEFVRMFSNDVSKLILQRGRAEMEIKVLKSASGH